MYFSLFFLLSVVSFGVCIYVYFFDFYSIYFMLTNKNILQNMCYGVYKFYNKLYISNNVALRT